MAGFDPSTHGRISDVHRGARWTIRLSETKNGRPHELPLGREARELLRMLPNIEGNPYIFVGRFQGECLSVPAVDEAWKRIRTSASWMRGSTT
jgi:integrase